MRIPMLERPDATLIVTGEKRQALGFKVTSGAAQVEVTSMGFDHNVTVVLNEESALHLANDLRERVERMRKARPIQGVEMYPTFAEPKAASEMRQDAMRLDAP